MIKALGFAKSSRCCNISTRMMVTLSKTNPTVVIVRCNSQSRLICRDTFRVLLSIHLNNAYSCVWPAVGLLFGPGGWPGFARVNDSLSNKLYEIPFSVHGEVLS